MGVLTLNIECQEKGVKKTMQFDPRIVVYDACRLIREKIGPMSGHPNDYGLFRIEDDPTKCVWMENGRTLEYYLIRNGDTLEYKNKIRQLRIRTLDGGAIKTVSVDESQPVSQLMVVICSKMGIANHEEYSLVRNSRDYISHHIVDDQINDEINGNYRDKERERSPYYNGNAVMNTIGRKKERQIQQLRAKLHTDEKIKWVDHTKTLHEQNIGEDEELTLRRKFFFSDTNVDARDPVQLNLLYIQCRDGVLKGLHPVSRDSAIKLAALQCYIEFGPFQEGVQQNIDAKDLLPKEYAKAKELEKNIIQEYRELIYEDQAAPKKKYCELCRSLPTYGVTFFLVKEKVPGKNRLIPRLFGINKESVMRVDEKSKAILKEWPLEQVRRWAASYKTFTLDFGDYKDGYYSVQTLDGEKIGQLIGGYIDIIMKKKRIADSTGLEGDEGATMLEDVVAPARATIVATSQISQLYPQDERIPGLLRSTTGTPTQAPQYGGISGTVFAQEVPKGERIHYSHPRDRSQRALIGTIEASIRAVEEAEEELEKPPQIDLPRFEPSQRQWRVEVEKEAVSDRLAAMSAATADVVQLTAIPEEEIETRVGDAIATIGSNLPEMGRGVRDLASIMPDEHRADDLVDAARKLCGAFGDFLDKVHPEREEKRATILSAASRVGELSHDVMQTMHERTFEEETYHDELSRKAKNVATNTAQLVLQAKTVSAECEEMTLKEQVIHSAMKTAFATSELVACTRVVGPTIENQRCKDHLIDAAHAVSRAVEDLLVDANAACSHPTTHNGQHHYQNLNQAADRVNGALDDLINHVETGPMGYRRTTQDYSFEQIVESSNRIITNQNGHPRELVRDSESAIRHSQLLADGFQNEAIDSKADQKDRLLNAARSVAEATSVMIDATRECQTKPNKAEAQIYLKNAAENLVQVTSQASSQRLTSQTILQLGQAAKDASAAITQTVAAINSARPHLKTQITVLINECAEASGHVPLVVQRIKETQSAETPGAQFRAYSNLIHDVKEMLPPAARLVEVARNAVPVIADKHTASILSSNSQQLSLQVAELRSALSNAQQSDFGLQIRHASEFIFQLEQDLDNFMQYYKSAQARRYSETEAASFEEMANNLRNSVRILNSSLAQLVLAARQGDQTHLGISKMEMAHSLCKFVETVQSVALSNRCLPVETMISNAKNVVHETGHLFSFVDGEQTSSNLEEISNQIQEYLRKTLASLPDYALIESAISVICNLPSTPTTPNLSPQIEAVGTREAAQNFTKSTQNLLMLINSSREINSQTLMEVFVNDYTTFHASVMRTIYEKTSSTSHEEHRRGAIEGLNDVKADTLNVLERLRMITTDPMNQSYMNSFSQATHALNKTVVRIAEHYAKKETSLWERECDRALEQIQSVRHIFANENGILIPINQNSYYESLSEVTNEARRLGEGMNSMAHYARRDDVEQLCRAVKSVSDAVCELAQNAAQSAYLIGISDPDSQPGRAAIYDPIKSDKLIQEIKHLSEALVSHLEYRPQMIKDAASIATHASNLASICRDVAKESLNLGVRTHFLNSAREITSTTASLINSVKNLEKTDKEGYREDCANNSRNLRSAVENLEKFIDNPDFGSIPATISAAGRDAQQPLVYSINQMLGASFEMISIAKNLDENPTDASIWQQIANTSRTVSESIKQLVTSIRDQAPGQADIENAIIILQQLNQKVDEANIEAVQQHQLPRGDFIEQQHVHQQIVHSAQQIMEKTDSLKIAAISHAEAIGRNVRDQLTAMQTLVRSCIQAVSLTYDSRTQLNIFEQCKTVIEADVQMMLATKDSGGNPKAVELHTYVEQSAEQLTGALVDLQRTIHIADSEAGVFSGIIDSISRSIALVDQTCMVPSEDSLSAAQIRMVESLNEVSQIASDSTLVESHHLGQLSLQISDTYKRLAEDTQIFQNLMTSPNIAHKVKSSVQKLGTTCIELVKHNNQRKRHPTDNRTQQQLGHISQNVQDRVREVLANLNEGSRGTQACINAAQTVSGVIGDLDTTIIFATSGTLNTPFAVPESQIQANQQLHTFSEHREAIIRTARALVEDTKALVSGAASNQEQLAVACQCAVRTILELAELVKTGANLISSNSVESQVMIIHAVRDVAAALSNLIQSTTHACGRNPSDPTIGNLKIAAKVMVSNVSTLLKTIKVVDDKSQCGMQALDSAISAINIAIEQYDNESPVRQTVTIEEMIRATCSVTTAATKATEAASSLYQEQIIAAANLARQSVADLLVITKASAHNADNIELRFKMLNSGREVALQIKQLLSLIQSLLIRPGDRTTEAAIRSAAQEISRTIGDLAQCTEHLRGTYLDGSPERDEYSLVAANELFGARKSIEDAAAKISQIRPRKSQQTDEDVPTFDEQILTAANSIANAVHTLVKAASAAQKELVEQGRIDPNPALATEDYQWSEGLVSAAKLVAVSVQQLCEAANSLIQGHSTEEKLISAAKQVASSTAHLLMACKVKSDTDSRARQRLQSAGMAVKTATEHLVNAAKQAITEEEKRTLVISDRMVNGIAQVMDAKISVLTKEKELEEARTRLAQLNRSRYEKSPEPEQE